MTANWCGPVWVLLGHICPSPCTCLQERRLQIWCIPSVNVWRTKDSIENIVYHRIMGKTVYWNCNKSDLFSIKLTFVAPMNLKKDKIDQSNTVQYITNNCFEKVKHLMALNVFSCVIVHFVHIKALFDIKTGWCKVWEKTEWMTIFIWLIQLPFPNFRTTNNNFNSICLSIIRFLDFKLADDCNNVQYWS